MLKLSAAAVTAREQHIQSPVNSGGSGVAFHRTMKVFGSTNDATAAEKPTSSLCSLNALLQHRIQTSPNEPIICFPFNKEAVNSPASAGLDFQQFTYAQLDALVRLAATQYASVLPPRQRGQRLTIVGLLASTSVNYVITEMALCRLGHCTLLLSPNNSVPALANLMQTTSADRLLYSPDQERQAQATIVAMAEGPKSITAEQWVDIESGQESSKAVVSSITEESFIASQLSHQEESGESVFIVHSSGSTGFPKPIYITHCASVANLASSFGRDALVTVPLCHNYGHASLWRAVWSVKRLFVLDRTLTPDNVIAAMAGCLKQGAKQFYAVPLLLKMIVEADDGHGLALAQQFEIVTSAGSACPAEVGNQLVQAGVRLVSNYGTTEVGQLMTSLRPFETDFDWQAVRMTEALRPYASFESRGGTPGGQEIEELFELVVLPGWPAQTRSNRPDGSYATSDLFKRHRTIPDAYIFAGRSDDTLVHSSGEKTNPVPMELDIKSSAHVREAVVFGAGRPQAGVLVVPSLDCNVSSEAIQAVVEQANANAPSHSRIIKELVVLLPASTRFASADKGSFIRAKVLEAHQDSIEAAYRRYEHGESGNSIVLSSETEARKAVKDVVVEVLQFRQAHLDDELANTDFFAMGLDSIGAARIANLLRGKVQLAHTSSFGANAVFRHATINKLSEYVWRTASSQAQTNGQREDQDEDASEIEAMKDLLRQCRELLESHTARLGRMEDVARAKMPKKRSVVLTGATGSLGAHLLHALLTQTRGTVEEVYCLCRARDDTEAVVRVEESLEQRGLPAIDSLQANGCRVVCLSADLTLPTLGLAQDAIDYLQLTVTDVLHNAWPVNFKMSVSSFAPFVLGSVHIVNLLCGAQEGRRMSPARFFFSSSVSAAVNRPDFIVQENVSLDPRHAQSTGYARSKWLVEHILSVEAKNVHRALTTCSLRIGQMVGDRAKGIWNETEAVPLMLRSAQSIGCLPSLDERVSWLPVDDAAWMITRVLTSETDRRSEVVHIVNDALTPFSDILAHLSADGNLSDGQNRPTFEVVKPSEWVARLRHAEDQDPRTNPTIKLVDFFEGKYGQVQGQERKSARGHVYATEELRALLDQEELEELGKRLRPMETDQISKMIATWRRNGFMR